MLKMMQLARVAFGVAAMRSPMVLARPRPQPRSTVGRLTQRCDIRGRSGERQRISLPRNTHQTDVARQCSLLIPRGGATAEKHHTTLAGKLLPFLSNFALSKSDVVAIYEALARAVDLREFALIALFAWAFTPFLKLVYDTWQKATVKEGETRRDFCETKIYKPAIHMSQAAIIGVLIYAADCIAVIMNSMGFHFLHKVGFSRKAANLAFFAWVSARIMRFKRILIFKSCRTANSQEIGRAKMYNGILDIFITVMSALFIIERLDLDFGVSLKSLFAFGGVGTLVLSLASKDLAGQLVNGVAVTTSERFFVGDKVKLGDGTKGVIQKIGLLYTDIRGSDEIVVKIPNSQIANQRTSNISRVDKCQVKQTLRFMYEDIDKLPAIMASIKEEIVKACPALITDGSRAFHVHWREFKHDHLEVVVDCHFNLPAKGTVYWDNRQAVLEAISRGAAKHGVHFAIPSSLAKNVDYKIRPIAPSKSL